jgi:hypothetical protein
MAVNWWTQSIDGRMGGFQVFACPPCRSSQGRAVAGSGGEKSGCCCCWWRLVELVDKDDGGAEAKAIIDEQLLFQPPFHNTPSKKRGQSFGPFLCVLFSPNSPPHLLADCWTMAGWTMDKDRRKNIINYQRRREEEKWK